MTDKKLTIYLSTSAHALEIPASNSNLFTFSATPATVPLRLPLTKRPIPRKASHSKHPLFQRAATSVGQVARQKSLRRSIEKLTGVMAVLGWVATMLVYLCVKQFKDGDQPRILLEATAGSVGLLQAVLVVGYWEKTLKHAEAVRLSLDIEKVRVVSLTNSPKFMALCGLECAYHAMIPYSGNTSESDFTFFGEHMRLSIEDMFFILIVLRNHHTVRFLYWSSHLSGMRVRFYAYIWKVKSRYLFVLKCYLAEYAVNLISQVFVLMLVVSGLLDFAFEHHSYPEENHESWDHFWLVSITQTTIGYGDIVPRSFFGQVTILVSCFFGVFLLGLINTFSERRFSLKPKEDDMYYHITHAQKKTKHRGAAIVLVQRWWRFMKARASRRPKGELVLQLFVQLNVYRSILLQCHSLQFLRIERQIQHLGSAILKRLSESKTHLYPVCESLALVTHTQSDHFLTSHQYTLALSCCVRDSAFRIHRRSVMLIEKLFPSSSEMCIASSPTIVAGSLGNRRRSTLKFAKIKHMAYFNAVRRSVRGIRLTAVGSMNDLEEEERRIGGSLVQRKK